MSTVTSTEANPRLAPEKRVAILEAARRLFLEHGYVSTGMETVAEVAGVGIKTVYRHFENKEALFLAVVAHACALFTRPGALSTEAWRSRSPKEALHLSGYNYLAHVLKPEEVALYRVVLHDARTLSKVHAQYYAGIILVPSQNVIAYLEHQHAIGALHVPDPAASTEFLCAILKAGLFESMLFGVRDIIPDAEVDARAASCAELFVRLHAPPIAV